MADLSLMLADPDKDMDQLLCEMLACDAEKILDAHGQGQPSEQEQRNAQALARFIASSAREMKNKAANELSGVISTAVSNLALYRDPVVAANTSDCDFRISDLMNNEKPVSLYLIIRPSDIDRLRPLVRLIMNIVLRRLTESMDFAEGRSVAGYKHRLLLMMDEFTSLGRLEIFENALAFMAGYGIKAYIIVQDLVQLQAKYTKEESITSNCHVRIAFATNNLQTAKVLSEMTGKKTVVQERTSLSGNRAGRLNRANVSISEVSRPLLTVDECLRVPGMIKDAKERVLSAGDMLIFPAGFNPIYGRQILYFLDAVFQKRAAISAPEKSDSLYHLAANLPETDAAEEYKKALNRGNK
jgi:type IV secretion system protein VirD4